MGLFWDSSDEKERRNELKREARYLKSEYESESRECANLVKYDLVSFFQNNGIFTTSGSFNRLARSQIIHEYGYSYDWGDYYSTVYDTLIREWIKSKSSSDPAFSGISSYSIKDIVEWVASDRSSSDRHCVSLVFGGMVNFHPGEALSAAFDGAYKLHTISKDISNNESKLQEALAKLQDYRG